MDALIRARSLIRQRADTDTSVNDDDMPKHCEATAESEISEISEISADVADAAVATLRFWHGMGMLDTLPERIPGFADELAHYSDRARLIGMVRAILDAAPRGSLTAQERAVQFVTVLTPLLEGRTT